MSDAAKPDKRGIDLAIMAHLGARLSDKSPDDAASSAIAMLELFGFQPLAKADKP